MSKPIELLTKAEFLADLKGTESVRALAEKWGVAKSTIGKWRNRIKEADGLPTQMKVAELKDEPITGYKFEQAIDGTVTATTQPTETPQTVGEAEALLIKKGIDPATHDVSYGFSEWNVMRKSAQSEDGYELVTLNAYRIRAVPRADGSATQYPLWPVIQPVAPREPVQKGYSPRVNITRRWKTAILMADTQFGYRRFDDETFDPFHDDAAIDVAIQIVAIENPDRVVVMGDILDLQEQGRWAQEAGFALTTQKAFDRTNDYAVDLREACAYDIDFIEGNHDKRMQNFVEANAKAAFGLKIANMPESWPVMSIPNLLQLDSLGITYHDAYPTSHVWINDTLRAEHGTKVNSNGSTAQKYMNETPHISRAFGHTHRLEAISRTTYDRAGKIRSMAINPGCLCRVDGAVPGVHGAIGINGRPAQVFEDWQQGIAVVRYTDDDFRVDLVQIEDGMTVYQGEEINAR